MENTPLRLKESVSDSIGIRDLHRFIDGWLMAGAIAQHSDRTTANRRLITKNLIWYLRREEFASCGVHELRSFFLYLSVGHKEPGGRWGNAQQKKQISARTVKDYHGCLRTLFKWIVEEGGADKSPMDRIPVPVSRSDEIQPFSEEQVQQMQAAAKRSRQAERDEAIVAFLLDTGCRASELCDLRFGDIDLSARRATVQGKGNKSRPVYFGRVCSRLLWKYLGVDGRQDTEPLFLSEQGDSLTRSGLQQLIERLAKTAKITGVRASPHTLRHNFALSFLRNGGNQLTLMRLMGHTNMQMTARYVQLANADCERSHREFSPADKILGGKKS